MAPVRGLRGRGDPRRSPGPRLGQLHGGHDDTLTARGGEGPVPGSRPSRRASPVLGGQAWRRSAGRTRGGAKAPVETLRAHRLSCLDDAGAGSPAFRWNRRAGNRCPSHGRRPHRRLTERPDGAADGPSRPRTRAGRRPRQAASLQAAVAEPRHRRSRSPSRVTSGPRPSRVPSNPRPSRVTSGRRRVPVPGTRPGWRRPARSAPPP
ncbi:hypothetical protein H4W80_001537 [Nonomuraea angiospora]|uniref:Uncharacterized protein n=1 Tax=Nonomuraea angiospora TaxID=46172 RepID=A0ABR9LRJ6_9ACTN|nr:hypothetical protein [Nonomuraea angiospora]